MVLELNLRLLEREARTMALAVIGAAMGAEGAGSVGAGPGGAGSSVRGAAGADSTGTGAATAPVSTAAISGPMAAGSMGAGSGAPHFAGEMLTAGAWGSGAVSLGMVNSSELAGLEGGDGSSEALGGMLLQEVLRAGDDGGGGAVRGAGGWLPRVLAAASRLSLASVFPVVGQVGSGSYTREKLAGDLSAGLTVGIMVVPQSIGYAVLAGVSPLAGLVSSAAPLLTYALLGGCPQLSVGPVAVLSILLNGSALIAGEDPAREGTLASLVALYAGCLMVALGVMRLGFILRFLAQPVIAGFISAAGVFTLLSQVGPCLGFSVSHRSFVMSLVETARSLPSTHAAAAVTSALTIAALVALRSLRSKFPRFRRWSMFFPDTLVVVLLGVLAVLAFRGSAVAAQPMVGSVPSGIPAPRLPPASAGDLREVLPVSVIVAVVGFLEAICMATHFGRLHKAPVSGSRELIALGLANVVSALFGGIPVTGSMSRSAENAYAGATTGLSSLVAGAVVFVALAVASPAIALIPRAVLGGLVVVAAARLIQFKELRDLWVTSPVDFGIMVTTMLLMAGLGVEVGMACAVGLSLCSVFLRLSSPHTAVMGRLPGTVLYFDRQRFPQVQTAPGIVVFRFDGPIFFANADSFESELARARAEAAAGGTVTEVVVIDLSVVSFVDASGLRALVAVSDDIHGSGGHLILACVHGPVRDMLWRSGIDPKILHGPFVQPTVHEAVQRAFRIQQRFPGPVRDEEEGDEMGGGPRVGIGLRTSVWRGYQPLELL